MCPQSYHPKLIILGSDFGWEESQVLMEAARKKIPALMVHSSEIRSKRHWRPDKGSIVLVRRTRQDQQSMIRAVKMLDQIGIDHSDSTESIEENLDKSLFMPKLHSSVIHSIPTTTFSPGAHRSLRSHPYPVILKPALGRHGRGIHIAQNEKELEKKLSRVRQKYLVQPYLPFEVEYRIFVIGKKALGVVEKKKAPHAVAANYHAGSVFLPSRVPKKILQECVQLCRRLGIDIGGVDLGRVKKKYYLLEINRCPEFRGFMNATGINVPSEILTFLQDRIASR